MAMSLASGDPVRPWKIDLPAFTLLYIMVSNLSFTYRLTKLLTL